MGVASSPAFGTCLDVVAALIAFVALIYGVDRSDGMHPPKTCGKENKIVEMTPVLKVLLIITHTATFVLIPVGMRVFFDSLPKLGLPPRCSFATQLGLAFTMVSIASEIGWHVTQKWYYVNQFTALNFMFYYFLLSGFALWSNGFTPGEPNSDGPPSQHVRIWNVVMGVLLIVVSACYVQGKPEKKGDSLWKIPIYCTLVVAVALITCRAKKVLKSNLVWVFPILSVGVNLFFIMLLEKRGGCEVGDPHLMANAIFHISHDVFGTLAGVAFFIWLIHKKAVEAEGQAQSSNYESLAA